MSEGLDPRCDVWGLGALLYFVLTKEPPFGRVTPQELLVATEPGRAPEFLPSIVEQAPPELLSIVRKSASTAAIEALSNIAGDGY